MSVVIPNPRFTPRPYQKRFMLHFTGGGSDGRGKAAAWVVHRRGGKDLTGMHTLNMCAHRRTGAYWHTFPSFEQGRKAIWEGFTKDGDRIIDSVFEPASVRRRDNQQMVIELVCGSIYRVIGTDRIETVGAGPVGVLHSEYSIAKPSAADLIAPMLRENDGWEAYVYTPRGNNHGKKLYDRMRAAAAKEPKRYFCDLQTLYDTRAYDPEATMAEERARGRPEALIRQEYLCDWTAALVGSVWGDLLEALEKAGGVTEHAGDVAGDVFTSWDLGGAGLKGDATAIWWWKPTKDGADLLDYYEAQGKPLSHYLDKLEEKAEEHRFDYAKHWVPHDSRSRTLVSGVSVLDQLLADPRVGPSKVAVTPNLSFADGIQAARWLLQRNIRFHPRCEEGLEALKAYHYDWDEDRKTLGGAPVHDWSSHCADAFRYAALVVKFSDLMTRKPAAHPPLVVQTRGPTLDELREEHERRPVSRRVQ